MSLLDNLIAHFKADEASGTRNDSHGANHLTDNNTVTQAAGKIGNAAQFTRANAEFLSIADNAPMSTGDIDFTIAGWVYLDSKPDIMMFASKDAAAQREYWVGYDQSADRIGLELFDAGGNPLRVNATTFGSPGTGAWIFFAAWHDSVGGFARIQINNGTVDSVDASAFTVNDSTTAFCLGARMYGGFENYLDGRLDEVGFWKRVLTADERTALYNGGAGFAYPFSTGGAVSLAGPRFALAGERGLA